MDLEEEVFKQNRFLWGPYEDTVLDLQDLEVVSMTHTQLRELVCHDDSMMLNAFVSAGLSSEFHRHHAF